MKHLGERVTSLVDDQLDDNTRDQILAHLTRCASCRALVSAEREIKATLRDLGDVEPSPGLVAKLHAIAEPGGPFPPQRRPFPATAQAVASWPAEYDAGAQATDRRRPLARRGARLAVGSVFSVAALTVLLAGLGGPGAQDAPSEVVEPEFDRFSIEHARSAGTLPFLDPAAILVSTVPGGQRGTGGMIGPMGPDK